MHKLLGDMLMCLIYVMDDFSLPVVYSHRRTNGIPGEKCSFKCKLVKFKTLLLQNKPNDPRFPL
jgi:hypothetical protein